MQDNSRPLSARFGALSAAVLIAATGTFVASPATADTGDLSKPKAATADAGSTMNPGSGVGMLAVPPPPASPPAPNESIAPPELVGVIGNTVDTDSVIMGQAFPADTVELIVNGEKMVVGVSPTGEFHIIAPTFVPAGGRLHIIAEAVKGDVRSRLSSYDLVLRDAPLPAPSITSSSMAVGSLTQVSGTAMPGARVRVSIRVDGADDYRAPVEVMANMGGTWDLTLAEPLSYGTHIITAAQGGISGKADSAASSLNAYVRPAAPRIISPADGSWIAANQLPEAITGTAVPGATVELQVDADPTGMGETVALPLRTQADAAGNWSIPMSALIVGQHRIVAVQAVGLLPSDIALSAFHVTAAEVGPETPTLPVLPGTAGPDSGHKPVTVGNPGTGGVPVPVGNPGTGDGSLVLSGTLGTSSATDGVSATGTRTGGALAETGATDVGLLTGGGAALLVAGAAALIYGNRRRAVSDS